MEREDGDVSSERASMQPQDGVVFAEVNQAIGEVEAWYEAMKAAKQQKVSWSSNLWMLYHVTRDFRCRPPSWNKTDWDWPRKKISYRSLKPRNSLWSPLFMMKFRTGNYAWQSELSELADDTPVPRELHRKKFAGRKTSGASNIP